MRETTMAERVQGWRWVAAAASAVVSPTVRRALNVAMHREHLELQLRALDPDRFHELLSIADDRQAWANWKATEQPGRAWSPNSGLESVVRDVAAGEL
jgi:hypothetical protein